MYCADFWAGRYEKPPRRLEAFGGISVVIVPRLLTNPGVLFGIVAGGVNPAIVGCAKFKMLTASDSPYDRGWYANRVRFSVRREVVERSFLVPTPNAIGSAEQGYVEDFS